MQATHSATFVIKSESGMLQYEKLYALHETGEPRDDIVGRWTRSSESEVTLLDTCLINLARYGKFQNYSSTNVLTIGGSCMAWHFGLHVQTTIDEDGNPDLVNFAKHVKLDPVIRKEALTSEGNRRVTFANVSRLEVLSIQQKSTWRFLLGQSDYVCEVSKIQNFIPITTSLEEGGPKWFVEVFSDSWDNAFAPNARLDVGNDVEVMEMSDFFPRENAEPGFHAFLGLLGDVAKACRGGGT